MYPAWKDGFMDGDVEKNERANKNDEFEQLKVTFAYLTLDNLIFELLWRDFSFWQRSFLKFDRTKIVVEILEIYKIFWNVKQ